ncbi:hypothetical protein ACFL0C_00580 [Patescibacteria group bacterium]
MPSIKIYTHKAFLYKMSEDPACLVGRQQQIENELCEVAATGLSTENQKVDHADIEVLWILCERGRRSLDLSVDLEFSQFFVEDDSGYITTPEMRFATRKAMLEVLENSTDLPMQSSVGVWIRPQYSGCFASGTVR